MNATGLARGEMGEDLLDDLASSLRERHFRGVSMHAMTRNVAPHTPQCSMSMWNTRLRRCIQLKGGGGVARVWWTGWLSCPCHPLEACWCLVAEGRVATLPIVEHLDDGVGRGAQEARRNGAVTQRGRSQGEVGVGDAGSSAADARNGGARG